jgi:hypothetical protein
MSTSTGIGWSSHRAPRIPLGILWSGAMSEQLVNGLLQIPHLMPCSRILRTSSRFISLGDRTSR